MLPTTPIEVDPGYGGDPIINPGDPPATPAPPPPPPSPSPPPPYAGGVFIPTAPPTPREAPTDLPVPVVAADPRYAAPDYAAAARALLPRGRAWPGDPSSKQGAVLAAIAETFARSDADASALLAGAVPGELTPLLPEWEASLGLPDFAFSADPTFAQRLDQVRGRFVGVGGQSRQAITDFAAALGFAITITNYAPFRVGLSTIGNPVASDLWTFVWGVTVTQVTGSLSVDVLMAELQAIKPAETTVILLS